MPADSGKILQHMTLRRSTSSDLFRKNFEKFGAVAEEIIEAAPLAR